MMFESLVLHLHNIVFGLVCCFPLSIPHPPHQRNCPAPSQCYAATIFGKQRTIFGSHNSLSSCYHNRADIEAPAAQDLMYDCTSLSKFPRASGLPTFFDGILVTSIPLAFPFRYFFLNTPTVLSPRSGNVVLKCR